MTHSPLLILRAFVFDAYGTLFDVLSVTALCEALFPGRGAALAQLWRLKQLQRRSLDLTLTAETRTRPLDSYLTLAAFPDVRPGSRR
jgi:2-haloacid dehalogenase